MGGVGLALLAAGLLINNEYIRRHRTIHVVNACGQPVQVRVDDGPPQTVASLGRLTVGEGRHRVRVSGPVEETRDIDVRAGFFDRWFGKPAWVLNPGGEAVLEDMTIRYAVSPQPPGTPVDRREAVRRAPSRGLRVRGAPEPTGSKERERAGGEGRTPVVAGAGRRGVPDDRAGGPPGGTRLRRAPPAPRPGAARPARVLPRHGTPEERPRVEAFLKSGLDRRPVPVLWHRAYQSFAEMNGQDDGLVGLYDRYLQSEPA